MKFMKKNRPDVMIIILLILWGIYEIFVVPFEYDTLVSIFVGFNLVYLFPWCCKETSAEYLKIRNPVLSVEVRKMLFGVRRLRSRCTKREPYRH